MYINTIIFVSLEMLLKKVMKKYKKISNYKWSNRPKPAQISDYSLKEPHRIFLEGLWPHFFKQACVDIGEIRYIHTYTTKNLRKFQLICFAHSSRPTRAATFELNDQLLKFTRVLKSSTLFKFQATLIWCCFLINKSIHWFLNDWFIKHTGMTVKKKFHFFVNK